MKDRLTGSGAFLSLSAAAFIAGANLRIFDALLPNVAADFSTTPASAAVVVTAFTLAYGLFQIVYGPVGDRVGKLRVIAVAALVAGAASLVSSFAPSLRALAVMRFIGGMGAAAIFPLSLAWIGDETPYEIRQATLGRLVGFLLLGQIMGPALGGLMAQALNWRRVFQVMAAVFAGVGLLVLREAAIRRSSAKPSAPGEGRRNRFRAYGEVLRDPWVRTIIVVSFFEGAFFFGAFAYAGSYLKSRFLLSYALTGAILAGYGIGAFIYTLFVRRMLILLGERGFVGAGGLVLLASFLLLAVLPAWQAAPPLMIATGFGFYMFHNTLQTKATEMAPGARGTGLAVFAFSLFMGQTAGVAAAGRLIPGTGYPAVFAAAGVLLFLLSRVFARRLMAKSV